MCNTVIYVLENENVIKPNDFDKIDKLQLTDMSVALVDVQFVQREHSEQDT